MPLPVPSLSQDLTGQALANKITAEVHTVNGTVGRAIATNYGAFFTESLVVRKLPENTIMLPGIDYVALHLQVGASKAAANEVCSVINFLGTTFSSDVSIDYQAIGGAFSGNVDAIRDLIDAIAADQRPVSWGAILFLPEQFTPAAHLHYLGDVYGWEGVIKLLDEMRVSMLTGDQGARQNMYTYLAQMLNGMQSQIDTLANNMTNSLSTIQQIPVGSVMMFARKSAPTGWIKINGQRIGSATSYAGTMSGGFAGQQAYNLYQFLWSEFSSSELSIWNSSSSLSPTTKGLSAQADWNANKFFKLWNDNGLFWRTWNSSGSGVDGGRAILSEQADENKSHSHYLQNTRSQAVGNQNWYHSAHIDDNTTDTDLSTGNSGGVESRPKNRAYLACIKY